MPSQNQEVSMYQNMSKKNKNKLLEGDDLEKCTELQATTYLNMSICFYLQQKYQKCIEKASASLELKKSIKAYYRRGQAYAARKDYENAIRDLENAIKLDVSDPNDIQQELIKMKGLSKQQEKELTKKMQGFLIKDNQEES
mmetsp:Transcript_4874/g.4504  ORF Transcript_4874/g.4504 Transcript_4874/m.4504 type:complete len:141 (+) Transcript_4874:239-661(+)|eukprot:CAMPEP_0170542540 /NCGR_PEP_ID=MMETSP0211-20121228/1939_1 /TAXON_ID=311385 /ORGANISM="Pseudokeronopsis sp., Strain OXSARD2" /LENGTH=140 /DNA_ID=CAMNT_0010845633 /DNA_START=219 /DNA_END=641 /DNA_ORIENTATION=-